LRLDNALPLQGNGVKPYLDGKRIVALARQASCDAIHPGYGFLSENVDFATMVEDRGMVFVGPLPESLQLFGDKIAARRFAAGHGIPVPDGSDNKVSVEMARRFLAALPDGEALIIKAVAGGGGRGMRIVRELCELDASYAHCRAEALKAFGCADLYVEHYLHDVRHIEVQILGDGQGRVVHFGERDCTLQRRHQKVIEIAPAPRLGAQLREAIIEAALKLAVAARFRGLGTFEFLLDEKGNFVFVEANPRLQVEHPVTEMITGVDLVAAQLQVAAGEPLPISWLDRSPAVAPEGMAVELRILAEVMQADGTGYPSSHPITCYEPPGGPGIRCDGTGYTGYRPHPSFDSLLAKLVIHHPVADLPVLLRRADRALGDFRIMGPQTNRAWLCALLRDTDVGRWCVTTEHVTKRGADLYEAAQQLCRQRLCLQAGVPAGEVLPRVEDPLEVLTHGKAATASGETGTDTASPGIVRTPMPCTLSGFEVKAGDIVAHGQPLLVLEAMKMEHVVNAPHDGCILELLSVPGAALKKGDPLVRLEPRALTDARPEERVLPDPDHIRPDLKEMLVRRAMGLDENRPEAVTRRHRSNHRTARENIADLCDENSFIEYGPLVIAAQRRRRELEDLIRNTPADGMIAGLGRINGELFGEQDTRCIVVSYDYMVLAGTQGQQNHRKKDRMFELAEQLRCPVVIFAEGGGGRPGDTDGLGVAGLDCLAFHYFGRLSGLVPLVGIASGRCFAGNAALFGCCDLTIATRDANIGMGGPAMVEGGGLGIVRPEDIGPASVQAGNGVVDILVADEAEAVRMARKYLSYFQGALSSWRCEKQEPLRHLVPENRLRVYNVQAIIERLADCDSVLEIRGLFAPGMITALVRVEGRPLGIVANNPEHLAGAIDSDGADKATRFMQLCDAFDLPLLFLCDCPGIMVGPEAERHALVRHASRMFVTGASLSVPFFTIVLRKSYGLGAQAMAGGSFKAPCFVVSWPTGEFGGMGLEGAVKLGYRRELAALDNLKERQALFKEMVERMYQRGKALNVASHFEIDDVIDPADSRKWISNALNAAPPASRTGKKRPCIDTW